MLSGVREEIQSQYRGTPDLQEPQLCFGREADSRQVFTLNSAGNSRDLDMNKINKLIDEITPRQPRPVPTGIHSALLKHAKVPDIFQIRQRLLYQAKLKK
jgi:hypothetical protein